MSFNVYCDAMKILMILMVLSESAFSAGNFLFVSQKRTREKLVNVLSLCGQEVGLTKNPSVSPHCHSWEDTLCGQPYIFIIMRIKLYMILITLVL